jgi:2'-hydroxyisoflavone reductase
MTHLADAWRTAVPNPQPINWSPPEDRFHLPHDGTNDGTFQLDNSRAMSVGLHLRPDQQIARDYVTWVLDGNTPPDPPH